MAKEYDKKSFYFTLPDGRDVLIVAWRYEWRGGYGACGWGHKASVVYVGNDFYNFEKRITYYNRTWESFTYESMLRKIICDFFSGKKEKLNRECLLKQVQAIADHESEKCAAWLKAFETAYNGLTGEQRQSLADADIEITNEKQADVALATIQAMALLNA